MQDCRHFQILRRNPDGTVRIEYLRTDYADIEVPKDKNGNELCGLDLLNEIQKLVISLDNSFATPEIVDPDIVLELEVMNTTPYRLKQFLFRSSTDTKNLIVPEENIVYPTSPSGTIPKTIL